VNIEVRFQADFGEVNQAMSRIMAATAPRKISKIAIRRAYKQVKGKYAARFAAQVNKGSSWQQFKKQIPLPSGGAPGFFTGTTYNAIRWSVEDDVARVFLEGTWPEGSFSYPESGARPKPGDKTGNLSGSSPDALSKGDLENMHAQVAAVHWGGKKGGKKNAVFVAVPSDEGHGFFGYIDSEPLATKQYGKDGNIKFMYLDQEDVGLIRSDIERLLDAAVHGKKEVTLEGGVKGDKTIEQLDIPEEERKAMETAVVKADIGAAGEEYLAEMLAKGTSAAAVARLRRELEDFLKDGGSL